MRLFQRFEVRKLSDDELEIVPVARPEVITGYTWDEERDVLLEPTLRREPLGVNPSENFRNIEVAV
jgi:hypothetical protein